MSDFMSEIADQVEAVSLPTDKQLEQAQAMAARLVQLDNQILKRQEELSVLQEEYKSLAHTQLPDLFTQLKLDHIGLPDDNCDVVLKPFTRAGIAASWEPERRQRGFDELERVGGGDLIKTTVSFSFSAGEVELAREFVEHCRGINYAPQPDVKTEVHHGSLTSFVKKHLKDGLAIDLEAVGATVGNTVEIKKRKTK